MFRVVASPARPIGLAYGFLIGSQVDAAIRKALPGWAIVLDATAPTVTRALLDAGRALVKAPADTPIGLMGWSNGCLNGVRSTLMGNLVGSRLQFVHVVDGIHASVPPTPQQIEVWANLIERARKGEVTFTATASSMTYTKNIRPGEKGRAWPTSWVLDQALGLEDGSLQPNQPIIDGRLYVEKFPSPEKPTKEAAQAHRDQVNVILPATLEKFWKLPGTSIRVPAIRPENAYDAMIQASDYWQNLTPYEDKGYNRGDAIDQWLLAVNVAVGNPYCAAFAGQCIRDAFGNLGRPAPVKGSAGARALMQQFKAAGLFVPVRTETTGTALPESSWRGRLKPGALGFYARPPKPENGHVDILRGLGDWSYFVTEGNADRIVEEGRIRAVIQTEKRFSNPNLLGFGVWD